MYMYQNASHVVQINLVTPAIETTLSKYRYMFSNKVFCDHSFV